MEYKFKVKIYKAIIEHLLSSTEFTLIDIADHTGSSLHNIRSIYIEQKIPSHFPSEIALIKLYQIIVEIQKSKIAQR